jgi:hypothetical protein
MLELHVRERDTEAALELDQNQELSIAEMSISGCSFLFASSPSRHIAGIWKWFGQLQALEIRGCSCVIYWPEEEFLFLVSLTKLKLVWCTNLTGRAQTNGIATRARDELLPQLKKLEIDECESLTKLFVLPRSITHISIDGCRSFEFIWGKDDTEPMSVRVEHGNDLTAALEQLQGSTKSLPCLESLYIRGSDKLATLPNIPPSLKELSVYHCPQLRSISGHLDALMDVGIGSCNKLESPEWGNMPTLKHFGLLSCKRLTSLPGSLASYSALTSVLVQYCPAINMKPLYEHLPQRLDSLEYKDLSHVRSSDPSEGNHPFPQLLLSLHSIAGDGY